MRCPKGTAARVRSWRRDIVRARAQFHFSPTRQRLVVRVAVPRPHLCLRLWFCSWLAGCWLLAACLAAWLLAAGCGWRLLPAVCCLLSAACCLLPAPAMRCLLRAVFAPAPASAGPARNGIWMKMRASTMSLRQLRTRAAVPFGHRIGAPFTNMLLFTSPSYHFKVLERKGSASARANVLRQNGDTFNYKFIGGQPPPKTQRALG